MAKTINTRLVIRNAELSAWEISQVGLLPGEMALARLSGELSNNYKVRIGVDGEKTWSQLSDQGQLIIPASNVEGLTATIAALSTSYYETTDIATLSDTYVNGDIAIEKKPIADGKEEYCAYRWSYVDGAYVWKALDGNYSAENVYFKEDITCAGNYDKVGNITKTTTGTTTIAAAGRSVKDVMNKIFTKELPGAITRNPSMAGTTLKAKVNGTGDLVTANNDSTKYEVGTYLTDVQFSGATFTKGTYTYGPTSEQSITAWTNATTNSVPIATGETSDSGTLTSIVLADKGADTDNPVLSSYFAAGSVKVTTTGAYATDTVSAYTNLPPRINSQMDPPEADVVIPSGSKGSASAEFRSARKCFWGYRLNTDVQLDFSALSSADMRALQHNGWSLPSVTDKTTNFTVPAGTKQIILLKPNSSTASKIDVYNNSSLGAHMDFSNNNEKLASAVTVEGANGYTGVAYDVWYLNSEAPFATECKLAIQWK